MKTNTIVSSCRDYWDEIRPSATEDESETENSSPQESEAETTQSFQVGENELRQALEDEIQTLQLSNIELKTKYKAAKTELKSNPSSKLETENRWLEKKVEKCRTDLQRRRNYFENEKSKLEEQLEASNARIAELENDLEDQKLAFDKLKSEHESSSDQSTIQELKIKLRNSKWPILENQNCEDCKDLQNEKIKLEKELEIHKLELNKLKSEHEAFSSQQPKVETSCQSCKKPEIKNRPQESTKKVISKQSKLSRSQAVRVVKERHNSLDDC